MKWDEAQTVGPRGIARLLPSEHRAKYSICVMATRHLELRECLNSFITHGFTSVDCEYLIIDNSGANVADAYVAVNEFLQSATGDIVIIAHQDVVLLAHGRSKLDGILSDLERSDPNWAVCGNAGFSKNGRPALYLSDPHDENNVTDEPFPVPVVSLDENFLVIRRLSNLAVSRDLSGFHHYGADLCTIADVLGWSAYVIEFFLHHKSAGRPDKSYVGSRKQVIKKYRRAFRPRWIHVVTLQPYYISGRAIDPHIALFVRRLGKLLGIVPRARDFENAAKRAQQNAR